MFLDHDLGGEQYVDTNREDCGMEVVRQLHAKNIKQDARTLFVIHTLNSEVVPAMRDKLTAAGYKNVVIHSFRRMNMDDKIELTF